MPTAPASFDVAPADVVLSECFVIELPDNVHYINFQGGVNRQAAPQLKVRWFPYCDIFLRFRMSCWES